MTAHKPVQFARHATIVLAGAASLSLTVAAGAYIVHQMANTQRGVPAIGEPARSPAEMPDTPRDTPSRPSGPSYPAAVYHGYRFDRPAVLPAPSDVSPPVPSRPEPALAPPAIPPRTPSPAGFGGRVDVGDAYVGARVEPAPADAVTVTVDTNVFAALTQVPGTARTEDTAPEVTRMRTEIDTERGAVTVTVSDPAIGEHDLRLERTPAPAPATGATRTATESTLDTVAS